MRGRRLPQRPKDETRVNERIRKSPVRLIDENGGQVGIVPIEEARQRAENAGLDLVEVGAKADPPVVKILDWGKVKYEKEKQAREARKKTHVIEVKEVKYRPNIDRHDMERKTKKVKEFLAKGKKVKVTIFFRYRQLRRPELGTEILDGLVQEVQDIAAVESRSGLESRRMVMVLAPLSAEKLKTEKAAAGKTG
jgi:translation initiation factor IF-3